MRGLQEKSVIITGAGSGIGRATALMLAERGSKVTIADINQHAIETVREEVLSAGGQALAVSVDVSDERSVRKMVSDAINQFGALHGAVNAAGVPPSGKPLHEIEAADWDRTHIVNLRGLFFCNKYQINAMLENDGGSVVNIASTSAMVGFQNAVEYCASKAGVLGLTRGAAIDYATKGVRVNAVLPGGTLTPMLAGALETDPSLEAALASVHPMNRFGKPEEVAATALFLVSDEASYVTGAAYAVDGGHTAI